MSIESARIMLHPAPARPELDKLMAEARTAYDAMTPEQKQKMWEAQRKSWCIGETMLHYPEMTREEAEALYDKAIQHG